jgi:sigma-B regulation protein RsbU (phosphoserine phosphatase)
MKSAIPEGALLKDLSRFSIAVLLVDDQAIIGEAVRRMLVAEKDIDLHYCSDPAKALETANRVRPTVILQDLVMPEIDGMTLVKFFRANPGTRETPLIVLSTKEEPAIKAEAFALGANDYLVKLPDKIELVARIRYHSKGYINLLERNEAYKALSQSRQRLAEQMDAAAKYVQSLLPAPSREGVRLDWRYVPSADLGGDTFGYHWLDGDHLALYMIDVTGHGLDSALFSVTIMNVLRSRALPSTDFRIPGQVLAALNEAFPMEAYGEKCFTIWYGVFDRAQGTLSWSGGGHPDALLFEGNAAPGALPARLESAGPMMGMMPWPEFETKTCPVVPSSRLYLYSDGVHEIHKPDGTEWTFAEFVAFMAHPRDGAVSAMDELLRHARDLHGSDLLDDDFSIVEALFLT